MAIVPEIDLVQAPSQSSSSEDDTIPKFTGTDVDNVPQSGPSDMERQHIQTEATKNLRVLLESNLDSLIAQHEVEDPFLLAGNDESTCVCVCVIRHIMFFIMCRSGLRTNSCEINGAS